MKLPKSRDSGKPDDRASADLCRYGGGEHHSLAHQGALLAMMVQEQYESRFQMAEARACGAVARRLLESAL